MNRQRCYTNWKQQGKLETSVTGLGMLHDKKQQLLQLLDVLMCSSHELS